MDEPNSPENLTHSAAHSEEDVLVGTKTNADPPGLVEDELVNQELIHIHDHNTTGSIITSGQSLTNSSTSPMYYEEARSPEAVKLQQLLDEMSPLYLPRSFKMLPETFEATLFPLGYRQNSEKEIRLLKYSDNFWRQYSYLYRDRTRLLLSPQNECNVRKFVCTTIRPTKLPFPELYDWQGIAAFVADFLEFCPLVPSTDLPTRLLSPATTLSIQMGSCFEYTTLMCSLLVGVGYDAYVVSGYATRECCYKDETRKLCPLMQEPQQISENYLEQPHKKYQVKPIKDFLSKYELSVQVKQMLDDKKAEKDRIEAEKVAMKKREEPLPDPLYGLRVHSWILVLPGQRGVEEGFFIEPLTGLKDSLKTKTYLGVESIWNNLNYWVNMQDCSSGIQEMRYDLLDLEDWEPMLVSGLLNKLLLPEGETISNIMKRPLDVSEKLKAFDAGLDYGFRMSSEEENREQMAVAPGTLRHFSSMISGQDMTASHRVKPIADIYDKLLLIDLPLSWVRAITLSRANHDQRYPNQLKEVIYNRAKVIKYSPYSMPSGIVTRLTVYSDRETNDPIEEREYFQKRADNLVYRATDLKTFWVTEKFDHGRMVCQLKEHGYRRTTQGPDAPRYMLFYDNMRTDGLVKRERTGNLMKEWYHKRKDLLLYRETEFGRTVKKFGPPVVNAADNETGKKNPMVTKRSYKAVDKITERFARNPSILADEDVEERVFNIIGERYHLTYHIADACIFPCTREFVKPPDAGDRRQFVELHCDTHTAFHTNPNPPKKTNVEIYQMLLNLMDLEIAAKETVRYSEKEVAQLLALRDAEEANPRLEISLWDTLRNAEMHSLRVALEKHAEQERKRQKEKDLDYLRPYLSMQDADSESLTREQAFAVREGCLQDLKDRLIKKANIIQARFEGETSALQKKQQWFQLNQINLTKDDEAAYLQYCNDAIFRITTLETMLMRHKQTAPQKYMLLEKQLRSDQRLAGFLTMN